MPPNPPLYDCIVLGAGIAGVTAARDLQRRGLAVLLLEGSGRIGGRMYTKRDFVKKPGFDPAQFPIEAGAEYIHVARDNRYKRFFQELDEHNFRTTKFQKYAQLGAMGRNRVFFPGWDEPKNLVDTMLTDCPEIWQMKDLFIEIKDFDPASDLEGARAYVQAKGYQGKGHVMAEYAISAHTPGILDPNHDMISVDGLRADRIPDQLLEKAEHRLEDADGTICGFDSLPMRIAEQFQSASDGIPGTIRLDSEVTSVRPQDSVLKVVINNGQESFLGRTVICTFSVGMLNPATGRGVEIFGDMLTPTKRSALDILKMGAITKFSLEFNRCVWGENAVMTVLSNPTGLARTFFSAFPDQRRGPFVLTGLLMGKDHEHIESLDDDQAVQFLYETVQDIYNPNNGGSRRRWGRSRTLVRARADGSFVPNFHRQDWGQDRFALGGNSYLAHTPNGELQVGEVRETLKDPRETLPLFWAGEATAPAYDPNYQPLSVHGAFISGVKVAEDVQKYLDLAANADQFRNYYQQRYAPAIQALTAPTTRRAEATSTINITLNAEEIRRLQVYAHHYTRNDLNLAAEDLLRFSIRTWMDLPEPDHE